MLKHLVLRDLLKAFSKETETDPFSQILKEGGILVKFKNKENEKEFIDQGVIKFKLSQKEGKEVIEVEKVSPNLEKFLPKKEFSKNEIKKIEDLIEIINGRTGLRISPYLIKTVEFKQKKDFVKEIIENHILLEGGELFFRLVLE